MLSSKNLLTLVGALFIIAGAFFYFNQKNETSIITPQPTPIENPDIITIQSLDKSEKSEVRSPDGKVKLVMEKATSGDSTSYSFSVEEADIDTKNEVFSKTVSSEISFEMSPNAWSPDNKYFFIKEKGKNLDNYFVFKKDGESFSEDKQYVDIAPLFAAKNTGYTLTDVTGWASPTLIYLLTKSDSGEQGPTYWLEIPSLAIIRLADR